MAKKKTNGKAVAKTTGTEVALAGEATGAWGGEELGNDDIIIPKILLMQGLSELVTEGDAKMGEFRDSMDTDNVLGSDKKPVEVIIFGSFKVWNVFKNNEYVTTMPYTPENADLPWEEDTAEGTIRNQKALNFYCVLPGDVAKGEVFPYVLSCKGTSYRAAKKIATHIKKLAMFKKPSAAVVFEIGSVKTKNEKGTFFVLDPKAGRATTNKEINAAYTWHVALAKRQVTVHEEDGTTTSAPATGTRKTPKTGLGARAQI